MSARKRGTYTMKEACERIGVSRHTLLRWFSEGKVADVPRSRRNNYRQFRDEDIQRIRTFAEAIPAKWRNRPIYLTESNHWIKLERAPNEGEHVENGWINKRSGWIQAAYAEIARWNSTAHAQQIQCYLVYRWTGDQWAIEGMGEVQADFKEALNNDYRWRR